MSRRRPRLDATHRAIVGALRGTGWYVLDLAGVGDGCPDLVAARAGRVLFLEIKDGTKSPSERKLTPAESRVHRDFAAAGVPVQIVNSVDEALTFGRD